MKIKEAILKRWEIVISVWIAIIALTIVYAYFLSNNKDSRDLQRYADILKIQDELKVYYSKNNTYPLPQEAVNITSSWEILTYQWYFWEKNFIDLGIKEIKDPQKNKYFKYLNYYTYSTDEKKQKFQLMAFYENLENTSYNPLTKRTPFTYWDQVWIALEQQNLRPIQETKLWVDVSNTTDIFSIYIDNENILVWDNLKLKLFLAKQEKSQAISCLDIKNAWWNKSWEYYINPLLNTAYSKFAKPLKVYCDLESDSGGWTRLYYKNWSQTCSNWDINYNSFMIEKIFTKDFAVSDNLNTLKSEWSWLLKDVDFKHKDFNLQKMTNVSNCKTPTWEKWSTTYDKWYLSVIWTLYTMWSWKEMFFGCDYKKTVWEKFVLFNIWWLDKYNMTWDFIHSLCNNYSDKDNSITSRWDWDNTRVIWVR